MQQIKSPIKSLSIISSCGCNLSCKYCVIAQTVNSNSGHLQQATIQALQDGSFLNNCIHVLSKLGQSPGRIEQIDLWGQEPTLTLPYLTENLDKWLIAFPGLKGMFFSTNGVAYPERIVDFILTLDKYATHPMVFKMQVSYDGDLSTSLLREAQPIKIQKNILTIIEKLNTNRLQNIQVEFHFNGVASLALIKELNTWEKVVEYYKTMDQWVKPIEQASFNKNVFVSPFVVISPEIPVDASTEDGLMMADFYRRTLRINPNIITTRSIGALSAHIAKGCQVLADASPGLTILELLEQATVDKDLYNFLLNFLSHSIYCGAYFGELKIMYDGTCILCQNNIFETDLEYMPQDKSTETNVRRNFVKKGLVINPLYASDEQIDKTFNLFYEAKNTSFYFLVSNHLALMNLLLKAHQIDESYHDPYKQLVHAFLLAEISGCGYNNYIKTGSLFGKDTGFIRYYCNGLLDEIVTLNPGWRNDNEK